MNGLLLQDSYIYLSGFNKKCFSTFLEMLLSESIQKELKQLFINYIDSVNKRRFVDEPWDYESASINSPFNLRLIPTEIWKASKYERSFVTSTGNTFENISKVIGREKWGFSKTHYRRFYTIYEKQHSKINSILDELDHKDTNDPRNPDWEEEKIELDNLENGSTIEVEVISDLYLLDEEENKQSFIEIKSPKPNKDQTKVSKEKMLKIYCGTKNSQKNTDILFCLPFNPWGLRHLYNHAFPKTYFDMINSPCVLMGKEFWDYVGKSVGIYEELLELTDEVGIITKRKVSHYLKYDIELDEVYEKVVGYLEMGSNLKEEDLIIIIESLKMDKDNYSDLLQLFSDNTSLKVEDIISLCKSKRNADQ